MQAFAELVDVGDARSEVVLFLLIEQAGHELEGTIPVGCVAQLADFDAALSIFLELERGRKSGARFAFGAQVFHGEWLARVFLEGRLGDDAAGPQVAL